MKPSPRSDQVRALREAKFGGRRGMPSAADVKEIADRAESRSKARTEARRILAPDVMKQFEAAYDKPIELPSNEQLLSDLKNPPALVPKETKMPSLATRSKAKGFDKGLHSKLNMRLVRARAKGDKDAIEIAEKGLRAAFPNAKPQISAEEAKARKIAKAKARKARKARQTRKVVKAKKKAKK